MSPVLSHGRGVPAELSTFIGRRTEIADVAQRVTQRRLVTLTGVGGCGKSRLAGHVASRLDDWADGVWWIDLGAVIDPALVSRTVATAVGVRVQPDGDPLRAVTEQLGERRALLCLDTCEHVLDAVAEVVGVVLRACPGVSVLATSREALNVPGEAVYRVPPLADDDALALFGDRAALAAHAFQLREHDEDARTICARLDGIPLAIELAAAWVRHLNPAEIAQGLADSFQLLDGVYRRTVPRQQTLSASMAWSHDLLEPPDRVVFRRLAVFAGSFDLEAATPVCGGGDVSGSEVAVSLRRLVDRSLVVVQQNDRGSRFRLLDTVRHHATDRLAAADEVAPTRDRHLDHYLELAEAVEPRLEHDQDHWRDVMAVQADNIHAALRWGLSAPVVSDGRGRRLTAAMARLWFVQGQAREGLDFTIRALAHDPEARTALQARLLSGAAMLAMISGRRDAVTEWASRGTGIAAEVGDDRTRARCLLMEAFPFFFTDFERCGDLAAEAYALGIAAEDPFVRDWALVQEAYSLTTRERHADAVDLATRAYAASAPRGDRFCAAFARGVELFAELYAGRVREAVEIGRDMMAIVAPLGDYFAVGTNTANAAHAQGMAGDTDDALALMDSVNALAEAPGADVVGATATAGMLYLWHGDVARARYWFEQGTTYSTHVGDDWTAARCLPGLVSTLRRQGLRAEAVDKARYALEVAKGFGSPLITSGVLDEQALLVLDDDPAAAEDLHHEAMAIRRSSGLTLFLADSLDLLAGVASRRDRGTEAVRLLAAGDVARARMGYPRAPVDLGMHEALVAALRAALGDAGFDDAYAEGSGLDLDQAVALASRGRGGRGRPTAGWASLTPTEVAVAQLVMEGLTNPEIGTRLFISRATVKTHLSHIYAKLGVANRTELATLTSKHAGDEKGAPA